MKRYPESLVMIAKAKNGARSAWGQDDQGKDFRQGTDIGLAVENIQNQEQKSKWVEDTCRNLPRLASTCLNLP